MTTVSPAEILVDARGLQPPEPMELVLDALTALQPEQQVRMLIDREPVPLYRILDLNGYRYHAVGNGGGQYEIVIRYK